MKVCLVQLDAKDRRWNAKSIPAMLDGCGQNDLTVFPECFPFDCQEPAIMNRNAIRILERAAEARPSATFIGGGYVRDADVCRNRAYLVHRERVVDYYDKQNNLTINEKFEPGAVVKCFAWDRFKAIPLICADVDTRTYRRRETERMVHGAIAAGAAPDVPIIVCSYDGGLMTDYWLPHVQHWARVCKAPLLLCGVSGSGGDNGEGVDVGGGGSGVIWPRDAPQQWAERGRVKVDLQRRTARWEAD